MHSVITSNAGFVRVSLLSGSYVKHWHTLCIGGLRLGTSTYWKWNKMVHARFKLFWIWYSWWVLCSLVVSMCHNLATVRLPLVLCGLCSAARLQFRCHGLHFLWIVFCTYFACMDTCEILKPPFRVFRAYFASISPRILRVFHSCFQKSLTTPQLWLHFGAGGLCGCLCNLQGVPTICFVSGVIILAMDVY